MARLLVLLLLLSWALPGVSGDAQARLTLKLTPMRPQACYAPGTPDEYIRVQMNRQLDQLLQNSLAGVPEPGAERILASDAARWSVTATDGAGLAQGQPTTLTWGIVADGVMISGYAGEPDSGSILRSYLDGLYGSEAVWLPLFQQMFDSWGNLTGVTYVHEPNDDGAAFVFSAGVLGVRPDIRIGGHPVDGDYGILAYNFFPNSGDMVIDVPDIFYEDTSDNSLRLRNVLAHEHGHGLGLEHTCPVNLTKLMEPILTVAFDGPQHDDIRDANRAYGDVDEDNDSGASAVMISGLLENRSIDDADDIDYFFLDVPASTAITANLTPTGGRYLREEQNPGGSCPDGILFNSLDQQDLAIELLADDASTVLVSANDTGAGFAEAINDYLPAAGQGRYYLRVTGAPQASAQLYSLQVGLVPVVSQCGDAVVEIDGLEVLDGETYSCSATTRMLVRNATLRSGSQTMLTAPKMELGPNVLVETGAVLSSTP